MPNADRILFLHIPKTAGTSLKHYLFHRFSAKECLLDPGPRATQEANFDDYAFVAGHFDFDYVDRYRRPPFVLTCLRNPIDRALSAYHYQRTPRLRMEIQSIAAKIGNDTAAQVLDEIRRLNDCANLAAFLRREPELAQKNLGNVQTRFLAGASAVSTSAQQQRDLLTLAKKHLEACAGLLLTEFMTESLAGLGPHFGHDEFGAMPHDNATSETRSAEPPETMAALAELTDLDLELYRCAHQLWWERRRALRNPVAHANCLRDRLPDAAEFTFDQPIRGRGWHIREQAGDGWYCWSDQEATLHLALTTSGPHLLRFWVEHAASSEALQCLEVQVNGTAVSFRAVQMGARVLMEARVSAEALCAPADHVCIAFRVLHTVRPSDRNPMNPDIRRLGIALSRLQLQPCD
ncbi:MAG TPA: sulfotransferase family 2 domain-containing protein [Stellaceae bacterium]|nr:sulfotransferase family 2 domain-containing protein [Stellaceae bacterium]